MSSAFWGGLIFLGFGLLVMKYAIESFKFYSESLNWPTVRGKIVKCELKLHSTFLVETTIATVHATTTVIKNWPTIASIWQRAPAPTVWGVISP
jgi:hypothetical protein